jgi:nucleotide-binding universal stress UspA family protein
VTDIPRIHAVLVSTDFSEVANRAIPAAYAAVDDGGTVHLLHVLEIPETPSPLYAHYRPGHQLSAEERRKLHLDLEKSLRGLVPQGADARRIRTEVHVVDESHISGAIAHVAGELGVALICIGSHGRSGLFKTLLGSVSETILRESHIPVLIVPPPQDGK